MRTFQVLIECLSNGSRGLFIYKCDNEQECVAIAKEQIGTTYKIIQIKERTK
jgi:hypothetical protein